MPDRVVIVFMLAVAVLLIAIAVAVLPPGEVTYRSDEEVIGPVPQEPGVTTYAR